MVDTVAVETSPAAPAGTIDAADPAAVADARRAAAARVVVESPDPMALIDRALAEVGDLEEEAQPIQVEHVAAAGLEASRVGGVSAARDAAAQWPGGAAAEVVLYCLPESWRDEAALSLLRKLDEGEQALLMAWLGAGFWDGYGAGQTHARQSPPVDLRPQQTPA